MLLAWGKKEQLVSQVKTIQTKPLRPQPLGSATSVGMRHLGVENVGTQNSIQGDRFCCINIKCARGGEAIKVDRDPPEVKNKNSTEWHFNQYGQRSAFPGDPLPCISECNMATVSWRQDRAQLAHLSICSKLTTDNPVWLAWFTSASFSAFLANEKIRLLSHNKPGAGGLVPSMLA